VTCITEGCSRCCCLAHRWETPLNRSRQRFHAGELGGLGKTRAALLPTALAVGITQKLADLYYLPSRGEYVLVAAHESESQRGTSRSCLTLHPAVTRLNTSAVAKFKQFVTSLAYPEVLDVIPINK